MSSSAQNPQPPLDSDAQSTDAVAADAATSADRLIRIIEDINRVDVAASSLADRAAVVELLEVTTDEQRSSLLLALLLQQLGTDA
ncbi:hypothetical protein [Cryobacterium sp.]|jgi:hypothetical protein|uniref:hypothetical protein n=1 Tax=Cryobacterium sp. TaxID=1926290 RepID=UPI00260DCCD6|nr:hypothetical protein [Cryobacterium sp.]MCU1446060.1 hypothetical protein [Cryobacterium sp.]